MMMTNDVLMIMIMKCYQTLVQTQRNWFGIQLWRSATHIANNDMLQKQGSGCHKISYAAGLMVPMGWEPFHAEPWAQVRTHLTNPQFSLNFMEQLTKKNSSSCFANLGYQMFLGQLQQIILISSASSQHEHMLSASNSLLRCQSFCAGFASTWSSHPTWVCTKSHACHLGLIACFAKSFLNNTTTQQPTWLWWTVSDNRSMTSWCDFLCLCALFFCKNCVNVLDGTEKPHRLSSLITSPEWSMETQGHLCLQDISHWVVPQLSRVACTWMFRKVCLPWPRR